MKTVSAIGLTAICVAIILLFGAIKKSANEDPIQLEAGLIPPCHSKPNCVSSEVGKTDSHYIAPLTASGHSLATLGKLVEATGGNIASADNNIIIATYTSRIFGFVDDVTLQLQPEENTIKVRSASRLGYSDMNANRDRVETLRSLLVSEPPDK